MLCNDEKYIVDCLRVSLGAADTTDESLIEDEDRIVEIILRNGILLTVYNVLSDSIQIRLGNKYNSYLKQSIRQDYEGKRIFRRLEEEGLTCVGLKGWELRALYPDFTMRQMSDIDVLVLPYDFERIRDCMLELGFTSGEHESINKNDTFRKDKVSVETHKRLTENSDRRILEWEKGIPDRADLNDKHKISNEDFYIHHIIHLHHDYGNGALGLRRIADTWLLQKTEMDKQQVESVLEKLGLSVFHDRMVHLSMVCFGDEPMDENSEFLIRHACKYGIFGTEKSYKVQYFDIGYKNKTFTIYLPGHKTSTLSSEAYNTISCKYYGKKVPDELEKACIYVQGGVAYSL